MALAANRPLRWWIDGAASGTLQALVRDFDREVLGPRSTPRSRVGRKRFYRLEAAVSGEPALYVKEFRVAAGRARLGSVLRPSKAQREQNVARAVRERGFEVVVPIAVAESRWLGLLERSVCVSEERTGSDLRSTLADPALPRARRARLLESFAELTRRMHDAGVDQDDSSPNNFLVESDDRLVLIDFERCSVGPALLPERRHRLLAKLHRHRLGVTATDRLRFLASYLGKGASREELRCLARAIEGSFYEIRRRDARRAAAGAFQVGRHVGRREGGGGSEWFVKGREGGRRVESPGADPRELWTRALQLERLGLPAARPVSLDAAGVVLSALEGPSASPESAARARREFERFGEFVAPPSFVQTEAGPALADLSSYRVRA